MATLRFLIGLRCRAGLVPVLTLALALTLGIGAALGLGSAAFAGDLTVRLHGRDRGLAAGRGRFAEGFALLPPGAAPPDVPMRLETASGQALPTLAIPVGRHRDGSARSLRLAAWVPPELTDRQSLLRLAMGPSPRPIDVVTVAETSFGAVVAVAGMEIELRDSGADLLSRLTRAGRDVKDRSRAMRVVARDESGAVTSEGTNRSVRILAADPLRADVEVAGELARGGGEAVADFRLRIRFRAGVPQFDLRLEVRRRTGGRLADCALEIPLAFASTAKDSRPIRFGFVGGVAVGAGSRDDVLERAQVAEVLALDGRRVVGARESGEIELDSALRCGIAASAGGAGGVTCALVASRLRPLAPRAVTLAADGVLRLVVLRGEQSIAAGLPLVIDGALGVFAGSERAAGLASLAAEPLPSLVRIDAAAFPCWSPIAAAQNDPNDLTARLLTAIDAGIGGIHGWRDYGDYRLGRGFANLEYDPILDFVLAALGAGDARHLLVARDMARHFVWHDLSRGELGSPAGIPWQHGDDHVSFEFEPGHVFAGGLVAAALIEDDPDLLPAALGIGTALESLVRDRAMFVHERDYAWSLLALSDVALLVGDEVIASSRDALLDALLASQAKRGFFALDRKDPRSDGPGVFEPTPWVSGGITLEALWRVASSAPASIGSSTVPRSIGSGDESPGRCEVAARRLLDYLTVDARYENGEFAEKVAYDGPGEVVLGRKGVAGPVDRLLIAAGLGRAGLLLRDESLLDLADREATLAAARLKSLPVSAGEAARALVGWRSIVDTRARRLAP